MSKHGPLYDGGTDIERLYFINKIPNRYWKVKPSMVSFSNMSYAPTGDSKIRINSDAQTNYYQSILQEIIDEHSVRKFAGNFVCLSSAPSEEHSMAAGTVLAMELIKVNPTANVGVVDLSGFYPIDKSQNYDIVLIHNVTCDSTRDRIQYARDYINWATRSALCILCTSGKTPLEMCYEVLRMPANMVLYSDERSATRTLNY